MTSDYTVAGVSAFQGYPFVFVRVHKGDKFGVCAVQAYQDGRVLIAPNVIPAEADAYEIIGEPKPFWIEKDQVYGVTWLSKQFRDDWAKAMEKYR